MSPSDVLAAPSIDSNDAVLQLELSDVTGTHQISADDVQPDVPAGALASAVASRMSLPDNVPWALHTDDGAFLREDQRIGDQVRSGDRLWVSPKTHLG